MRYPCETVLLSDAVAEAERWCCKGQADVDGRSDTLFPCGVIDDFCASLELRIALHNDQAGTRSTKIPSKTRSYR